jgi:hypothetical protein
MITDPKRTTISFPEPDFLAQEWKEFNECPTRAITWNSQFVCELVEIVGAEPDDRCRDWLNSQEFPVRPITYGNCPRSTRTVERSEKQPDAPRGTGDPLFRGLPVVRKWAA